MGLTTCFGLHSQTTRLCESASWSGGHTRRRGSHPLGRPLPRDLGAGRHRGHLSRLQFAARGGGDFQVGLFPVRSPLLGESWLVSSPPLIDMLKFSGCSCLNSGRNFDGFSCWLQAEWNPPANSGMRFRLPDCCPCGWGPCSGLCSSADPLCHAERDSQVRFPMQRSEGVNRH